MFSKCNPLLKDTLSPGFGGFFCFLLYATFKRQVTQEKTLTWVWVSWKSFVSQAGNPPGRDTRLPAGRADALAKRWPGGSGSTVAQAACMESTNMRHSALY